MAGHMPIKIYETRRADVHKERMLSLDQIASLRVYEIDRAWVAQYDRLMARKVTARAVPYELRVSSYLDAQNGTTKATGERDGE